MKPIESWEVTQRRIGRPLCMGDFDFLLEGVPTHHRQSRQTAIIEIAPSFPETLDKVDFLELKRNTAIAAVTAFGIAERAEPIGPRQSRAEIESLLKTSGLEAANENSGSLAALGIGRARAVALRLGVTDTFPDLESARERQSPDWRCRNLPIGRLALPTLLLRRLFLSSYNIAVAIPLRASSLAPVPQPRV